MNATMQQIADAFLNQPGWSALARTAVMQSAYGSPMSYYELKAAFHRLEFNRLNAMGKE